MTFLPYPSIDQIPATWGMGEDISITPSRENAREFLRKLIKRIYSDEITPENLKADAEESGTDVKTAEAIVKLVAATPEALKRVIGEENYKKLDEAHENKYGAEADEKQENKSDIPILGAALNKAGSFVKKHPTATLLGLAALNAALSKSPEAGERMSKAIQTGITLRQQEQEKRAERLEEMLKTISDLAKEERERKGVESVLRHKGNIEEFMKDPYAVYAPESLIRHFFPVEKQKELTMWQEFRKTHPELSIDEAIEQFQKLKSTGKTNKESGIGVSSKTWQDWARIYPKIKDLDAEQKQTLRTAIEHGEEPAKIEATIIELINEKAIPEEKPIHVLSNYLELEKKYFPERFRSHQKERASKNAVTLKEPEGKYWSELVGATKSFFGGLADLMKGGQSPEEELQGAPRGTYKLRDGRIVYWDGTKIIGWK